MIKIETKAPPREFKVGEFTVLDHGKITLAPSTPLTNEMITLCSAEGRQCDISATSWGFYLGPSLNSRLINEGFKAALVENLQGQLYLMAVQVDKMEQFTQYLADSSLTVKTWFSKLGE